jgi:hypothetical protein
MLTKKTRRLQREQERARKARQRQLMYAGVAVVATLLIIGIGYAVFGPKPTTPTAIASGGAKCGDVESFPNEGRNHLNPGEPTPVYGTVPPTSGTHDPNPWPPGIYDNPVEVARAVHSMEHGYVIIWYNGISSDEINQLASIVRSDSRKLILTPFHNMSYKIALTAWQHRQTCDGVNEAAIRSFINQFRDQGPEQTPI